jgi:hypothetical protein
MRVSDDDVREATAAWDTNGPTLIENRIKMLEEVKTTVTEDILNPGLDEHALIGGLTAAVFAMAHVLAETLRELSHE